MRVRVKVCGVRDAAIAELAAELGVSWIGFIFYPSSPRFLSLEDYRKIAPALPPVERVFVQVTPRKEELLDAVAAGFDRFQLHFPLETPLGRVEDWAEIVSPSRLWLAPKLPPGVEFPPRLIGVAETFVIDTYRDGGFGGSGRTGDWNYFRRLRCEHPDKNWVLAGGLSPENVSEAIENTGAGIIDVNSGIESAPGVKDPGRLCALFASLAGD